MAPLPWPFRLRMAMPARSSSPAGPRQALKRKRQPLRPGAASALQVVGVLFALLFFAVLLDEVAQCVDYAWEAVTVNFVRLAYTVTAYFVVEHARENGSDKTLERLLAVLDWVKEEGPRILLLFFILVQPLASKIRNLDNFSVDRICPSKGLCLHSPVRV